MTRNFFCSFIALCVWVIAFSAEAQTQDYDRIAPKPVAPIAVPSGPSTQKPKNPAPAPNKDQLVVPAVKGWVLVSDPTAVVQHGAEAQGVVYQNVHAPDADQFTQLLQSYVGKPLKLGELNGLIKKIIIFYRDHDRPVVDVIVPEQDVTNGVLQLIIIEGRVGTVTVEGNRWFSNSTIRRDIRLETGDTIRSNKLQGDLDWANTNPFHSSDLVYRPGQKLGETNLLLNTVDRFPARFYTGYEDSGTQSTSYDRYYAGINWGDAFHLGWDQQLNYQYTTSPNGSFLRAHSGSYVIPLPWRHTLTFFGSYVDTKGSVPPLVGLKGRSYQISGRYTIPLPSFRSQDVTVRENFTTGFDDKYNNNSLEFGGEEAGHTLYDVDQFIFGYNTIETDTWGQFNLNETLTFSPGGFGGHNTNASYAVPHGLAESDYIYNMLVLERTTRLPEDFSLILRGTVQHSNGNLVPSEQLGFGGYSSIRGYDDREVNADEGYVFTTEVRTPTISFGQMADCAEWNDQMQFLGFWDYGSANNHYVLQGENPNIELSSVGAGFRYNISTYASVRFDYGFQLIRTNLDLQHGSRGNVGITLSY